MTNLKNIKKIHFIGIGGVSMSSLAQIMSDNGVIVSGSDSSEGEATDILRQHGIEVIIGHSADNIKNVDLVVYTAAIKEDNVELIAAKERGIPCLERAPFLGQMLLDYNIKIGVCGTHGKTTTTSMISMIFLRADKDPTVLVGGKIPAIDANFLSGSKEYCVFEACEYVDSFLNFPTDIPVVLNIEADHLDYFKDLDAIRTSFSKYIANTKQAIFNGDNSNCLNVGDSYKGEAIYFSVNNPKAQYYGKILSGTGYPRFEVYEFGNLLGEINLSVPGIHNVSNALAAIAVARLFRIDFKIIADTLNCFSGAHRRFELVGETNGVKIFDDYAHHPTEIKATLTAAKQICKGKVFCIFQPHTYTRTAALFDDFTKVLTLCDKCILVDIYSAREKNTIGISSEQLADKIQGSYYADSFEKAAEYVKSNATSEDIVITMGAGDVYKITKMLRD